MSTAPGAMHNHLPRSLRRTVSPVLLATYTASPCHQYELLPYDQRPPYRRYTSVGRRRRRQPKWAKGPYANVRQRKFRCSCSERWIRQSTPYLLGKPTDKLPLAEGEHSLHVPLSLPFARVLCCRCCRNDSVPSQDIPSCLRCSRVLVHSTHPYSQVTPFASNEMRIRTHACAI